MDGKIGTVDDFYFDDQTWQISYLVVTTLDSMGARKILVSVQHVSQVLSEICTVVTDVTVDAIIGIGGKVESRSVAIS